MEEDMIDSAPVARRQTPEPRKRRAEWRRSLTEDGGRKKEERQRRRPGVIPADPRIPPLDEFEVVVLKDRLWNSEVTVCSFYAVRIVSWLYRKVSPARPLQGGVQTGPDPIMECARSGGRALPMHT